MHVSSAAMTCIAPCQGRHVLHHVSSSVSTSVCAKSEVHQRVPSVYIIYIYTRAHTHMNIYIYIYICIIFLLACVYAQTRRG